MVHNEHDAFTVILFCAVTVQTIKKWEKLQNVCDVEHCQNKIFMATKMQTGSERLSDTQKKAPELCRHVLQSASPEDSDRTVCSLMLGGAQQTLRYVTELHSYILHD